MTSGRSMRVKAYTILELTIAMLIAAILIGITFTAYGIVSKSYGLFKAKNEAVARLGQLDHLLSRDFNNAELIESDRGHLQIHQSGASEIEYEFGNAFIVRKSISIDTFKIANSNLKFLNQREDISGQGGRIDELSFTINFQNVTIPFHYRKQYSSENLINTNNYALN